ncbi:MAG: hypothetical protein LBR23_02840 [Spirochaetaceae bacterium]|jgi:hypothetical protein|nr:hypothetical protein [Spirochaetaceae bacterium]
MKGHHGAKRILAGALCLGAAILTLVSCATGQEIKPFNYARDADDFQLLVTDVINQDPSRFYVRVSGGEISPAMLSHIRRASRLTEGTFEPGFVYRYSFSSGGASFVLFMMDAVIEEKQSLFTERGSTTSATIGMKACKWVLYRLSGG